jgi:hypothetical protein
MAEHVLNRLDVILLIYRALLQRPTEAPIANFRAVVSVVFSGMNALRFVTGSLLSCFLLQVATSPALGNANLYY